MSPTCTVAPSEPYWRLFSGVFTIVGGPRAYTYEEAATCLYPLTDTRHVYFPTVLEEMKMVRLLL